MKSEEKLQCPECNKWFKQQGYYPHRAMHFRNKKKKYKKTESDKIAEKYY